MAPVLVTVVYMCGMETTGPFQLCLGLGLGLGLGLLGLGLGPGPWSSSSLVQSCEGDHGISSKEGEGLPFQS